MSSILFGATMVPIIESDHILLLGYSILCKECYLTRFNHQKKLLICRCQLQVKAALTLGLFVCSQLLDLLTLVVLTRNIAT